LKAFGGFVKDLFVALGIDLVQVGHDDPVVFRDAITHGTDAPFGVHDQFLFLLDLSRNISNDQPFEQGYEFKVDLDERSKGDGFVRDADGILDLVRPDVLDGLPHS